MPDIVVDVREVTKVYQNGVPLEVLHGVSLQVRAGEFIAVIGQSGSGKSTLLNLIGALDRPTGGCIAIDGIPIESLDDTGLAELRNRRIGFIFQASYLLNEFTCLENVLMPVIIRKGQPDVEDFTRANTLLSRVGMTHRMHALPPQLSGGEQQRAAVIRALTNQPRLVLADEPTGNLDSVNSREIFTLMREINRDTGVTFIMVTHDERLAREADRVVRIQDGRLFEEE